MRVLLQVGPALEHWESTGIGNRTTLSARGGLVLRIPFGRFAFENAASLGVGGSPFSRRDLPPEAEVRRLVTWSFGAGLRLLL